MHLRAQSDCRTLCPQRCPDQLLELHTQVEDLIQAVCAEHAPMICNLETNPHQSSLSPLVIGPFRVKVLNSTWYIKGPETRFCMAASANSPKPFRLTFDIAVSIKHLSIRSRLIQCAMLEI